MKKLTSCILALVTSMYTLTAWADVEINATNFPDENFRQWVLEQSYGADGVLTDAEIAEVTSIDVGYRNIRSLQGIKFFTALTELHCYGNQLTALDVSGYTALYQLRCLDNQLTTLDVSGCTALGILSCEDNQLTMLDVSGCTALQILSCYKNHIKGAGMDALVEGLPTVNWGLLSVIWNENEGNMITNEQVAVAKTKGWNPQYYDGSGWKNFEIKVIGIDINSTNFPDENFRNWVLRQYYGTDEVLTDAEIAEVTSIDVSYQNIQSLKGIEFFTALTGLSCGCNQLTALDVSGCAALTWLDCYQNQLTTLDVSGCTALTSLYCGKNQLTTLDVSGCTALTWLECYQNQIKGAGMDTLMESLPTVSRGTMHVIWNENEGNVITAKQVAVAAAKYWSPQYNDGNDWKSFEIAINEENFPDENFRQWLLKRNYGTDGVLTTGEIAYVKSIDVGSKNIQSLQGIEFFTALTSLYCGSNQLTTLDVSGCTALTSLNCGSNQLTTLDVSGCTALTSLQCYYNQLTTLDLSDCTALTSLDCGSNQLTTLNVSGCTALRSLSCYNNQLTALDVSDCTALTNLNCYQNQLTTLDVSGCTALPKLYCYDNQLTALDVSGCTALTELYCYQNQLTTLDVTQNTALRTLHCYQNQLTTLDMSQNTTLKWLYCYQNQIEGAEMNALVESLPTVNSGLIRVIWNENEGNVITIEQVRVAEAKGWKPQYYNDDKWFAFGIAINEENFPDENFRSWLLKWYGDDWALTDKEITGVTKIDVRNKNIRSLKGIEFFTALTELNCSSNQLAALDVSQNTALTNLSCSSNQLTALDVSQNTALTSLSCGSNQLTALDVSQNTALTSLNCYENQLTTLNVSQNTALTKLRCYQNQLMTLDMSKNTALMELDCSQNQLTTLDMSKNTALTDLSCFQNHIKGAGMDALVESLPMVSDGIMDVIWYENEGNVMTTVQVAAAKAKGWMPMYRDGYWKEYAGSDPNLKDVEINEENFPDAVFREWLLSQSYGADGVLTIGEIAGVTNISVFGKSIQSLKGIEFFTALTNLLCVENQLTALNVSKNTKLTRLDCWSNQLTELSVSGCTELTRLNCYGNQLTTLDVSGCTALTWMNCNQNQLTKLNVSGCAALETMWCKENQLKDEGMDALVESLPTVNNSMLIAICTGAEDEGNVMTTTQVEAAKAKGWRVCNYLGLDTVSHMEMIEDYEGSDPTGIEELRCDPSLAERGAWYDLSGRRIVGQTRRGIGIVRYADGTSKKVLVK